jgi:hypothetical protein
MPGLFRRVLRWIAIVGLAFAILLWGSTLILWLDADRSYEPWNAKPYGIFR